MGVLFWFQQRLRDSRQRLMLTGEKPFDGFSALSGIIKPLFSCHYWGYFIFIWRWKSRHAADLFTQYLSLITCLPCAYIALKNRLFDPWFCNSVLHWCEDKYTDRLLFRLYWQLMWTTKITKSVSKVHWFLCLNYRAPLGATVIFNKSLQREECRLLEASLIQASNCVCEKGFSDNKTLCVAPCPCIHFHSYL